MIAIIKLSRFHDWSLQLEFLYWLDGIFILRRPRSFSLKWVLGPKCGIIESKYFYVPGLEHYACS